MSLRQHLSPGRIVLLEGTDKRAVLEEMVDVLAAEAKDVGREEISRAIWRREGLMSTGIGYGLAVPHVRLAGLSKCVMVIGVSSAALADFESLDPEPVRIVVMIAAPLGQHEAYIRLLADVVEVLKQPELRRQVIGAGDCEQVYRIVTGQQGRQEEEA